MIVFTIPTIKSLNRLLYSSCMCGWIVGGGTATSTVSESI